MMKARNPFGGGGDGNRSDASLFRDDLCSRQGTPHKGNKSCFRAGVVAYSSSRDRLIRRQYFGARG